MIYSLFHGGTLSRPLIVTAWFVLVWLIAGRLRFAGNMIGSKNSLAHELLHG